MCTRTPRSGDHSRRVYDLHRHSPSTSDKKVTLEERQSGWLLRGRAHLPLCSSIQATSWVRCFRVLQTHQIDSCGILPRLSPILAFILLYFPRLLLLMNKVYFKKECKAVSSLSHHCKRKKSLGHTAAAIFLDHVPFRTWHNSLKTPVFLSSPPAPSPNRQSFITAWKIVWEKGPSDQGQVAGETLLPVSLMTRAPGGRDG